MIPAVKCLLCLIHSRSPATTSRLLQLAQAAYHTSGSDAVGATRTTCQAEPPSCCTASSAGLQATKPRSEHLTCQLSSEISAADEFICKSEGLHLLESSLDSLQAGRATLALPAARQGRIGPPCTPHILAQLLSISSAHAGPAWWPCAQQTQLLRYNSTAAVKPETAASKPQLPSYQDLVNQEQGCLTGRPGFVPVLDKVQKSIVSYMLNEFLMSGDVKNQALQLGIKDLLFPRAAAAFRKFMQRAITVELRDVMIDARQSGKKFDAQLFVYFSEYVSQHYASEIADHKRQISTTDLRQPHTWYPFARALQRKIIYHAGPTNSGKTYNALEALKAAPSGLYCGPLRLLAMEVYDTLNAAGIRCNLITGQEKRAVPGARHISCTVETANVNTHRYDVAVIDEIQMLGDEQRGAAWTRALLGMPANEIHLCGDYSAVSLVKQLCKVAGDEFEVHRYNRFSELTVEEEGMKGGIASVEAGDCIVAFSRNRIFELKHAIEQRTTLSACVIYGSLPPETRRTQARLFNDPDNSFKILVASDAIGMGLNLNIRRIVFDSLHKIAGASGQRQLTVSEIKQIAGRAGRRNSIYPKGVVTCMDRDDIPLLKKALAVPQSAMHMKAAGLAPEFEQLEVLAALTPDANLATLLTTFASTAKMDGQYFFCNHDHIIECAQLIDTVPGLSLADRYTFCMAPVRMNDMAIRYHLIQFAWKYGKGYPVDLTLDLAQQRPPKTQEQLRDMESMYMVVMLWLWLSYRFPEGAFPGRADVLAMQARLVEQLDHGLEALRLKHRDRMPAAPATSSSESRWMDPASFNSFMELDPRIRKFIRIKDISALNMAGSFPTAVW